MGGGVGFVMPYLSNKRLLAEMSIALVMAIVATLTLEHSQIDLMVADWFYLGMGHWMVAKQAFFARFATVFWLELSNQVQRFLK